MFKFWTFKKTFENLVKQSVNEKRLFDKLKELIEDLSSSDNEKCKKLNEGFQSMGIKCLLDFRDCTLFFINNLPLKCDDCLLTTLPDELYQSYNDEELNAKTLKALRQFIRLQISEFFKRLLLLFVQNYYQDPSQYESGNFTDNLQIFQQLLENSKHRQKEILSLISFYKSFYKIDETVSKFENENELSNLWSNCRNVRRSLYRSISM